MVYRMFKYGFRKARYKKCPFVSLGCGQNQGFAEKLRQLTKPTGLCRVMIVLSDDHKKCGCYHCKNPHKEALIIADHTQFQGKKGSSNKRLRLAE